MGADLLEEDTAGIHPVQLERPCLLADDPDAARPVDQLNVVIRLVDRLATGA